MPQIPEAKTAVIIDSLSSLTASSLIRQTRFGKPGMNDGYSLRALNVLLGEGKLIITPKGKIDINLSPAKTA